MDYAYDLRRNIAQIADLLKIQKRGTPIPGVEEPFQVRRAFHETNYSTKERILGSIRTEFTIICSIT
jgi:hypothetical protein